MASNIEDNEPTVGNTPPQEKSTEKAAEKQPAPTETTEKSAGAAPPPAEKPPPLVVHWNVLPPLAASVRLNVPALLLLD